MSPSDLIADCDDALTAFMPEAALAGQPDQPGIPDQPGDATGRRAGRDNGDADDRRVLQERLERAHARIAELTAVNADLVRRLDAMTTRDRKGRDARGATGRRVGAFGAAVLVLFVASFVATAALIRVPLAAGGAQAPAGAVVPRLFVPDSEALPHVAPSADAAVAPSVPTTAPARPVATVPRPQAGPSPRTPAEQPASPASAITTPATYAGALAVESDPDASAVYVDGRLAGATPLVLQNVRAGSHAVWVEHEGYERWTAGVLVPADTETGVNARLRPRLP